MQKYIVKKVESGQTLEKYIKKLYSDVSLSIIYKLFRKKDIKVNGHWANQKYIVQENDNIEVYLKDEILESFSKPKNILPSDEIKDWIVYEDEDVLIVNKPRGLLVQADKNNQESLDKKVLSYLYFKNEFNPNSENAFTPGPAHRLDRNTSGLVVFGKNILALQSLFEIFKNHELIKKHYYALVKGVVNQDGEINAPLLKDEESGLVKVASKKSGAKQAISKYHVIKRFNNYTLLDVELVTGRTHQIRVHLSYIGHPLIGDNKYGDFKENKIFKDVYGFSNQFLQAYRLDFSTLSNQLKNISNKSFIIDLSMELSNLLERIQGE